MFGSQASRAIGDYAQTQRNKADELRTAANRETNLTRREELNQQALQIESNWGDQGVLRLAAHTVVGGLTGGVGGAVGAAAGTVTAPLVLNQLQDVGITGTLANTLTTLASVTVGAAAGGTAGGGAAFNEVTNNALLHPAIRIPTKDLEALKKGESLEGYTNTKDSIKTYEDEQISGELTVGQITQDNNRNPDGSAIVDGYRISNDSGQGVFLNNEAYSTFRNLPPDQQQHYINTIQLTANPEATNNILIISSSVNQVTGNVNNPPASGQQNSNVLQGGTGANDVGSSATAGPSTQSNQKSSSSQLTITQPRTTTNNPLMLAVGSLGLSSGDEQRIINNLQLMAPLQQQDFLKSIQSGKITSGNAYSNSLNATALNITGQYMTPQEQQIAWVNVGLTVATGGLGLVGQLPRAIGFLANPVVVGAEGGAIGGYISDGTWKGAAVGGVTGAVFGILGKNTVSVDKLNLMQSGVTAGVTTSVLGGIGGATGTIFTNVVNGKEDGELLQGVPTAAIAGLIVPLISGEAIGAMIVGGGGVIPRTAEVLLPIGTAAIGIAVTCVDSESNKGCTASNAKK